MSNSTNTAKESSEQELMTESSITHPSLLMCVSSSSPVALTSTEDLLMWLQQDSPASPSRSLGKERETMTVEICGHKPSMSFAEYDHDTACWRTSQVCLLTNMQDEYLETWPKAGLMLDGVCYPQVRWEHRISEIGSGLLPTPRANKIGGRSGKGFSDTLEERVMYATPNTLDGMPAKSPEALKREMTVARPGRSKPGNLRDQVTNMQNWPTPKAAQRGDCPSERRRNTPCLESAVMIYPTPQAHEPRLGWQGRHAVAKGTQESLTTIVMKDEGRVVGEEWNGGQLNVEWVEWLMGWPIGWTSLEPLAVDDIRDWSVDPADIGEIPRVASGVKDRVQRLKALGNGQVSLCVATAWKLLTNQ